MAILWGPILSASRVQHISDMHSKFALRPHHVWKYGKTSNLRPLRLGEEKKKEERRQKPQGKNIMVCPITQGDYKNCNACIQTVLKPTTKNITDFI